GDVGGTTVDAEAKVVADARCRVLSAIAIGRAGIGVEGVGRVIDLEARRPGLPAVDTVLGEHIQLIATGTVEVGRVGRMRHGVAVVVPGDDQVAELIDGRRGEELEAIAGACFYRGGVPGGTVIGRA